MMQDVMFGNNKTRIALIISLICIVLAFSAWFVPEPFWIRAHGTQRIDIALGDPPYYCVTITNADQVASVVKVIRTGKRVKSHLCAFPYVLTVHYSSGATKTLGLIPAHGPEFYEYRHEGKLWSINRRDFFDALSAGGVATSELTEDAFMARVNEM